MGVCFEDMVYALHTLRIIKLARDAGNPGFTGALDEYMAGSGSLSFQMVQPAVQPEASLEHPALEPQPEARNGNL